MSNDTAAVLRTGFYTTQSLGDKGCIRIDFKSLAELHQADDELRALMRQPADAIEVVALRGAYPRAGEREHDLRTELAQLRAALKFYADRDHYSTDDGSNWDSCSGEPANILWHESEPWFIEDGSVARAALEGDIPDFTPGKGNKAERRATQLLAQLQTDLTQRDNQSDQMRVLLQHLVYDYRAAIQAGYDKITALGGDCDSISKMLADNPNYQKAMALLLPDLESRPEERGTPETEPCSGCGTPGWTGACNKCVPY